MARVGMNLALYTVLRLRPDFRCASDNMAEEGEEIPSLRWSGGFDEEGKPHGQGILTYPAPAKKDEEEEEKPGDRFEGSLVHGQRQGKGRYTWSNGCYYAGEYENHMRHGHGTLIMPDKSKYEGGWSENKMHGEGFYTYANGDMYTGSFQQGIKHGKGSYYFKTTSADNFQYMQSTESQYIGHWENGDFINGTWALQDGSAYNGRFGNSAEAQATFAATSGLCQEVCNKLGTGWNITGQLGVISS